MMEEVVVIEEMSMKEVMMEVMMVMGASVKKRRIGKRRRVWGVLYAGRKIGCRCDFSKSAGAI